MFKYIISIILILCPFYAYGALFEDFTSPDGTSINGYNDWTGTLNGGASGGSDNASLQIHSNRARLYRGSEAGGGTVSAGDMRFSRIMDDIYNPILSSNQSTVKWGFQVPEIAFNPSHSNARNWAVVVASEEDFWNSGNGYYLSSRSNQRDRVIFGYFSGGLGSVSNTGFSNGTQLIITDNGGGDDIRLDGDNTGEDSATFRLEYNPIDNSWVLFGASDSVEDTDGLAVQYGATAFDSTYTGIELKYMGFGFDSGTTNVNSSEFITFDTISVSPDVSTITIICIGAIGILTKKQKRRLQRI